MSYYRLSWFTLSFVEWWVCLRKGTCLLPVFLLCVPISLLASNVWYDNYLLRVLSSTSTRHFHHNSAQNLHCVPIHFQKGQKNFKSSLWNILKSRRTWDYLLKKKREKKKEEVLMILSKSSAKEEFNKMTQRYFQSVSPFLPLPWTFVTP